MAVLKGNMDVRFSLVVLDMVVKSLWLNSLVGSKFRGVRCLGPKWILVTIRLALPRYGGVRHLHMPKGNTGASAQRFNRSPLAKGASMRIHLKPGAAPKYTPVQGLSPEARMVSMDPCKELLRGGVIEEAVIEWQKHIFLLW